MSVVESGRGVLDRSCRRTTCVASAACQSQRCPSVGRTSKRSYCSRGLRTRAVSKNGLHAVRSGCRVSSSAQKDDKGGSLWDFRRLLSSSASEKDPLLKKPWLRSLGNFESEASERPKWVPAWVPDAPPEWLEAAIAQLVQASRVAAGLTFALGTAALLRLLAFNPSCVPSGSMIPTLLPGDCVFVEIGTYRFLHPPARGDIVVFRPPSPATASILLEEEQWDEDGSFGAPSSGAAAAPLPQYVKRVVAVAGDSVQVEGGILYINGRPRAEEVRGIRPAEYTLPPSRVPPGTLFVLGDNRNRSADSHVWGYLPEDRVVGRSWLRWKPLSRFGVLN